MSADHPHRLCVAALHGLYTRHVEHWLMSLVSLLGSRQGRGADGFPGNASTAAPPHPFPATASLRTLILCSRLENHTSVTSQRGRCRDSDRVGSLPSSSPRR